MTIPKTDAPVYTDLAGLSQLKRAAGNNDPAAIRKVAQQFESMFTRMMLKSMRDASGPDPMFGSDQQQMYQGMADDQLAIELSKGRGLGLADMLIKQLQKLGVKGADAAAQTGGATASSGATIGGTASAATGGARTSTSGNNVAAARRAGAYAAFGRTAGAAPASDAEKASFVSDLWPQAQQAGQQLGVAPRNLIAQAALETNWGRSLPQDSAGRSSNNLFGIKASADWAGATVTSGTQEYQAGAATDATARFRAYSTPSQSFDDYVALLRDNPRYTHALNTGDNVQAFATALQRGGYATDPDYARKIAAMAGTVASTVARGVGTTELKSASALPITADTGEL
jgi:peptidoglycan hydrolase FlgJ